MEREQTLEDRIGSDLEKDGLRDGTGVGWNSSRSEGGEESGRRLSVPTPEIGQIPN
jgi:hypothetical protein